MDNDAPVSVADYISSLNQTLQSQHARVLGEVTSLKADYAKAIYFKIKDKSADAILDCMIWKNTYEANGVDLKVGDEIIVSGAPEVYAPYGRLSLKAHTIEYAGEGNLKREYEKLKKKLDSEGLFDLERKN